MNLHTDELEQPTEARRMKLIKGIERELRKMGFKSVAISDREHSGSAKVDNIWFEFELKKLRSSKIGFSTRPGVSGKLRLDYGRYRNKFTRMEGKLLFVASEVAAEVGAFVRQKQKNELHDKKLEKARDQSQIVCDEVHREMGFPGNRWERIHLEPSSTGGLRLVIGVDVTREQGVAMLTLAKKLGLVDK